MNSQKCMKNWNSAFKKTFLKNSICGDEIENNNEKYVVDLFTYYYIFFFKIDFSTFDLYIDHPPAWGLIFNLIQIRLDPSRQQHDKPWVLLLRLCSTQFFWWAAILSSFEIMKETFSFYTRMKNFGEKLAN